MAAVTVHADDAAVEVRDRADRKVEVRLAHPSSARGTGAGVRRIDLTPAQARSIAAALLCAAGALDGGTYQ